MSNIEKIAQISLTNARSCLEAKNYGRAFANFLLFLKLRSNEDVDVYMEFALASKEWFKQLENEQRLGDLFKSYDQACELYPHHEMVLNTIGEQLFRLGYVQEAAAYIRKSLVVNPDYLSAQTNLENICGHLVERWHFSMLNDRRRNVAYRFAIQKAIKSGYDTVLDIGTGTSILSLMCAEAGARHITACDGSRAMVDVASDVLVANGAQDRVTLLHKHSSTLQVPRDMPVRVKLMVTETFDAGLFGEHIVSTLIYAWKNLISTTPTGSVIPCGATMYMCGIECDAIRNKSRLLYPVLQHLDLNNLDLVCTTTHTAEEPYTTENLAKIPGGYKIITNITELLRISFCNLCELESLHKGKDILSELYVRKTGRLDAVAVWFDLHLDDTVTIATAADNESCWEQAVYPVTSIHSLNPAEHNNCQVKRKDRVRTQFYYRQDCLRLTKCSVVEEYPKDPSGVGHFKSCDTTCGHVTSSIYSNVHHQMTSEENLSSAGHGMSVKECSKHSLPFRKRKVEENDTSDTQNLFSCSDCDFKDSHTNADQSAGSVPTIPENQTTDCLENQDSNCSECDMNVTENENVASSNTNCAVKSESDNASDKTIGDCINTDFDLETIRRTSQDKPHNIPISSETSMDGLLDVNMEMGKCSLAAVNDGHHSGSVSSNPFPKTMHKVTCLAEHVDIEYVNDIELNRQYCHALEIFMKKHQGEVLSLLIVTPRLSFLGIQALKMGYSKVIMATSEEHHETLRQVAALNGCQATGEMTLLDLCDLGDLDLKVDLVLSDIVEPCGALRQQSLVDLVYHRFTSVTERGEVLPQAVKVHGLFIASEELESLNRVTSDEKTLGFHIAEFINVFQMQNHVNIDMSTLAYTKLTEVTELLSIDFTSITLDSGPDVLDLCAERSLEVMNPGKVSALIYWLEIRLDKSTTLNTLDSRCHWKQAAIMIGEQVVVGQGQMLVAKVMLQNSCLDVKIVRSDCVNGH